MINGLEGIPGSGKSYEACVFQVLAALKLGRKVITNLPLEIDAYAAIDPAYRELIEMRYVAAPIRGSWDADRVDPATGKGSAFELFDDGHVEGPAEGSRPFGTVWCYWSDWKHPKTGQGPLFLVDECHVPMPKLGTSKAVVEWYKLHRHFNCDVLLATQRFRALCPDIAEIMAMVIKVRKADVLGRPDEYIRKVHAGYRGAVIQESVRKYEPHYFSLYRSHTQGNAVIEAPASDVAPVSVRVKRWTRTAWALVAVAIAFNVWFFSQGAKPKDNAPGFQSAVIKPDGKTDFEAIKRITDADAARRGDVAKAATSADEGASAQASPVDPEPYGGKGLHLTGMMRLGGRTVYTFAVSSTGSVVTAVTSEDLVAVGYRWQPLTDCAGYLRWGTVAKAITCDAPQRGIGSPERPLVMRDGYGSDGRVPVGARGGQAPAGSASEVLIDGPGYRDPLSLKGGRG
ncbi:zonular occludens toxin [Variovorax guangxiensis]|uniref:Zonular occludens toxin n=1 Tax=Variovorax guangxiensis TaxID=1775474 RepID=A0A433MQZ2_9BURK|nr:zonular occludens toxin domain-containing protein [Variovorax guangxiensis]RUR70276.1 zonular occludens toxin [Variovorax guangxiensis]